MTAGQLANKDDVISPETLEFIKACNLYLICQRPAFSFSRKDFFFDGKIGKGTLEYKLKGKIKKVPFELPIPLLDGATSLEIAEYPHREIHTLSPNGKIVRYIPASLFSLNTYFLPQRIRDFEVLYIGQTHAGNQRTAIDRLRNHSTLQRILTDIHYKNPDFEIFLFLFEYSPYSIITLFDGTDENAIRDQNDTKRFISVFENPLTTHQQICLAEAGLIRYFQPVYNEKFRDNFPSSKQKVLDFCYNLDFSALIVEINTQDFLFNTFSKTRPPQIHHIAKFDLINSKARKSFFTFGGNGKKKGIKIPNVIPPSK